MKTTVSYFLDKRKQKKDSRYPLKLSVTFGRKNRSWSIGFEFTEEEYLKMTEHRRRTNYKQIWSSIDRKIEDAEKVISEMHFFSFNEFKRKFFNKREECINSLDPSSIKFIAEKMRANYERKTQFSMSKKIDESVKSILKFAREEKFKEDIQFKVNENISMAQITSVFCQEYEDYMLSKSKTRTRNGAGINLRHVRILFNYGIKEKWIKKEWYPFNDYTIPNERKVKQPLNKRELIILNNYSDFGSPAQALAKKAFIASFYFNGANAADFLRFRFGDIKNDSLTFHRTKIRNSRKHDLKPIRVLITPEILDFIKNLGGDGSNKDNYIFPVLNHNTTREEEYEEIRKFNSKTTKALKTLSKRIGLEKPLTLKSARHTLANILKNEKINREFIKDILGHLNLQTTENYLEGMDDENHTEIMTSITNLSSENIKKSD